MDEKEVHQARLTILTAADWWARDVMRSDKTLTPVEQRLFDAVTYYQRLEKGFVEIPPSFPRPPPNFPRPPHLPTDLCYKSIESEIPTQRYSDIPTVPSPPLGIPVVTFETVDIDGILDQIDKLDEEPWTGKTGKLKP